MHQLLTHLTTSALSLAIDENSSLELDLSDSNNQTLAAMYFHNLPFLMDNDPGAKAIRIRLGNKPCSSLTKTKKKPCQRRPNFIIGNNCFCKTHLPLQAKQVLGNYIRQQEEKQAFRNE